MARIAIRTGVAQEEIAWDCLTCGLGEARIVIRNGEWSHALNRHSLTVPHAS